MVSQTNPDNSKRFSVEQVLAGIEHYLSEHCGKPIRLDPEKSVLAYEEEASDFDYCPLDFLTDLASYFQLEWETGRWVIWLGLREAENALGRKAKQEAYNRWKNEIVPQKTIRKLALYLASHAPAISFEPVTVLGNQCGPAGVFYGLCQLPEIRAGRHGPSSPLQSVLSVWNSVEFWNRVGWISGKKLPEISCYNRQDRPLLADLAGVAIFALTWMVAIILCVSFLAKSWFFISGISLVATLTAGFIFHRMAQYRLNDPFPDNLKTLGDLARWVSQHQTAN